MTSFKTEWEAYLSACYPDGIKNPNQLTQITQAYYSGAYVALLQLIHLGSAGSHADFLKDLNALQKELEEVLGGITHGSMPANPEPSRN